MFTVYNSFLYVVSTFNKNQPTKELKSYFISEVR